MLRAGDGILDAMRGSAARRGEARRGENQRGEARRGEARRKGAGERQTASLQLLHFDFTACYKRIGSGCSNRNEMKSCSCKKSFLELLGTAPRMCQPFVLIHLPQKQHALHSHEKTHLALSCYPVVRPVLATATGWRWDWIRSEASRSSLIPLAATPKMRGVAFRGGSLHGHPSEEATVLLFRSEGRSSAPSAAGWAAVASRYLWPVARHAM
eukprot:CAMPEP_0119398360 /NCGR_PEP_ID=MMETSP1334-20130426/140700_1 /TAXON_ID=127549 /ORGANISM="Calcidiscus leptoporus, Strain RCC1130" /LENGTH=211 /DNA_ID=CAMNT_0007422219 /DNA_START=265 /DNA_END=900 /DNA_ORIENTATION=-